MNQPPTWKLQQMRDAEFKKLRSIWWRKGQPTRLCETVAYILSFFLPMGCWWAVK